MNNETLPFLSSQERLDAYQLILQGCSHIWSKNRLQDGRSYVENGETKVTPDKVRPVLQLLYPLTQRDPFFLAHLTSYAMTKTKSKDLQVFLTYVNSLSSADGTPFSQGSDLLKPNRRYVSAAAVHQMDPKLAARVLEVAETKYGISGQLTESRHFSQSLRSALIKYLRHREANIGFLRGAKKAGLGEYFQFLYKGLRVAPSDEAAAILRWHQRNKDIKFEASSFNFEGLSDLEIAQKIQSEKLPVLGVLGALPRMTPVIAVAILEQATGNQAVILHATFADAGLFKDPEILKLYEEKIKGATALDRVDRIKKIVENEEMKGTMESARADARRAQTAGLGKIYIHLDDSGSMQAAREFMIQSGTILAECVNNPAENFAWGMFGSRGQSLPIPTRFVKDGFQQALFGFRDGGSTNAFALYSFAREFGADTDIFVSDQEAEGGLEKQIRKYHDQNPTATKPRSCVIVDFEDHGFSGVIAQAYQNNGIPVAILKPDTLTESALVVDAVKGAILGPVAIVDEIMETPLLELPAYYYSL